MIQKKLAEVSNLREHGNEDAFTDVSYGSVSDDHVPEVQKVMDWKLTTEKKT